jgi:hypothetical protein
MQGGKKLDFAKIDKCKPVLLKIFLGWKSGEKKKNNFVPLWDRMEGVWLWTLYLMWMVNVMST